MTMSVQIEDGSSRNIAQVNSSGELMVTGSLTLGGGSPVEVEPAAGACFPVENCAGTTLEINSTTHDQTNVNANVQVANTDVGLANPVPVRAGTGATFPVTDNGGSLTVDGTVSANVLQGGTAVGAANGLYIRPTASASFPVVCDIGHKEDAAHVSGDAGAFLLGVRNDGAAVLTDADGDYTPVAVDSRGRVHTICRTDSGIPLEVTVNASDIVTIQDLNDRTEGSPVIPGTGNVKMAGVERDDALDNIAAGTADGDSTWMRVDSRGALWVRQAESKMKLSASTDGRPISITATASSGTTLHTAHATQLDFIFLTLSNISASEVKVTLEVGGTSTSDQIVIRVPAYDTRQILLEQPLTNSTVLRAFAGTTAVINATGYVRRDAA